MEQAVGMANIRLWLWPSAAFGRRAISSLLLFRFPILRFDIIIRHFLCPPFQSCWVKILVQCFNIENSSAAFSLIYVHYMWTEQ